jgi:DNA polymerase III subunit delta'
VSGAAGEGPEPPRTQRDFFGHEDAVAALASASARDRFPHAWLFAGPRGVGKATLAYRLARRLLAPKGAGLGFDSHAPAIRLMEGDSHPDVKTLARRVDEKTKKLRSEIGVDDVRALGQLYGRHASAGGWRIAIVDSADDLGRSAANALLKTLEEPPQRSVLILIAHEPHRLLPTIRSRCRRLNFGTLDDVAIMGALGSQAEQLNAAGRTALLRLSAGSLGRAWDLLASGGLHVVAAVDDLLAARRPDPARLHALSDELAKGDGAGFRLFLDHARCLLGDAAEGGDKRATSHWTRLAALANAADSLHIDRKFAVMEIAGRLAALRSPR